MQASSEAFFVPASDAASTAITHQRRMLRDIAAGGCGCTHPLLHCV